MHDARPRVLLAEGDPERLNELLAWLEPDGYRVLVARDAAEAVDLAATHHPDLLLLDLELPGGGGYAVVEALHARPLALAPEVIFLTNLARPEQIREGFAAGAVDYITRPFSPAQLRARVRTWLLRLEQVEPRAGEAPERPEPCSG